MTTEFHGNIACSIEPGHVFVIGGKTIDCATRLDIQFKSGKHENADIPLSVSVRFDRDLIIRSIYSNGLWRNIQTDENVHPYTLTNPLIPGDQFQFYILIGDTHFHIAINKIPYCKFPFLLPINAIRTITVSHDVQSVQQIDHRSIFPYAHPPIHTVIDKSIAFSCDTPKPYQPGHIIIITGIPSGNWKGRFILAFTEAIRNREFLHFNPRFHPEYVVARNAMNGQLEFGQEERSGDFLFTVNEQFKLAIALTDRQFLFAINGRYFTSFTYRSTDLLSHVHGFKMYGTMGMQLEITGVDHLIMGTSECDGFEAYSRMDVNIQ